MALPPPDHDEALRPVINDLIAEFPTVHPDDVEEVARAEFDSLAAESKAPAFVGILSERRARERLRAALRLHLSQQAGESGGEGP